MLPLRAARDLDITHVSEGLLMASIGTVCLALWRSKPTPRTFNVQREQLAAAVDQNPGRQLFLCVVEHKSPPPDEDIRQASSDMITAHGSRLAGCACVIEGTGFHAAITHTVLSGIVHGIQSPSPMRFFESTASACNWLQGFDDAAFTGSLVEHVELARSRLHAFAAPPS
jgi:hypothetical protein